MNDQGQSGEQNTGQTSSADATAPAQVQKYEVEAKAEAGAVVLPAKKYRLKMALLFSDVWAAVIVGYYFMIRNIVADVKAGEFSWVSLRMISAYIVVGVTLTAVLVGYILKKTRSVRTRIDRDNELRQDKNINVWLTAFDWTWLVLFVPTMVVAVLCGVVGCIVNWALPGVPINSIVHRSLGGIVFGFLCVNAAVVIFKVTPTRVLLFVASVVSFCLILLLMGVDIFLSFFEKFKHLGVMIDPLGYLLMGYVGFFFLRLIWIGGLFEYMAMAPNRLDIQRGLSESEKGIQRKDFRVSIDTEDVILRLFRVGRIIISFPQSDRLPMSYIVAGIDKKAKYAMEAASVVSIGKNGSGR